MPQNPDYVPAKLADLGPWADNFHTLILAAPTDYGLVAGDATDIGNVVTPFLAALTLSTNPATRTPVTVNATQAAKDAMMLVVRPFAVAVSQNPLVSGALKTGVGVTDRILTRTRNAVTAVTADGTGMIVEGTLIEFRATNPDTPDSKARPLGALGFEIQVQAAILPTPETDPLVWETLFDAVSSRPILNWPIPIPFPYSFTRFRVRWVGALLNGGGPNVGPWSGWNSLGIPYNP